MKRNTDSLPKFKGLAKELGLPRYATMGVLEAVWELTGKHAPRGNVGKFSNQEIADDLGWEGDADELVAALIKHRWLDTSDQHRLLIHDWKDHAPDWLKKAIVRSGDGWASDDVCLPVAASGGQRQPVAASGGLPNLTLPTQTRPSQTSSDLAPSKAGFGKDSRIEAGRPTEPQTVADWCKAHRITRKYLDAAQTPGVTVAALEAERLTASADRKIKNAAATAVYRVCESLGRPPPGRSNGTIDVSLQSILNAANTRTQRKATA